MTSTLHASIAWGPALTDAMGCGACLSMSREDLLSRHLFFSNTVELTGVIKFFDTDQPELNVNDNSAFMGSSQFRSSSSSQSVTSAQVTKPHRFAELFSDIVREVAAIGRCHGRRLSDEGDNSPGATPGSNLCCIRPIPEADRRSVGQVLCLCPTEGCGCKHHHAPFIRPVGYDRGQGDI